MQPLPEPEEPKTYNEIRDEFDEYKYKKKFETALIKFEKKDNIKLKSL